MFFSLGLSMAQLAAILSITAAPHELAQPDRSNSAVTCDCTFGLATDDDIHADSRTNPMDSGDAQSAQGPGAPCGSLLLFQTNTNTITAGTACSLRDSNNDFCFSDANGFARSFDLSAIAATAGKPFVVECVDFGVGTNTTLNNPHPNCAPLDPGGDHPVAVFLYRDTNGGAPILPGSDLEQIGSAGTVVPLGTQSQTMRAWFDPPVRVAPNSHLVVELFTPTRIPFFGGDGGVFLAGFNTDGEFKPGYLLAPNCGLPTYTPMNQLFPLNLVLEVSGRVSQVEFIDPYFELLVPAAPGSPPSDYIVGVPSILATEGRSVLGAAADGATQVVVRVTVGDPGDVQLDLAEASGFGEGIGELRPRTGGAGSTSVTVPVENITLPNGSNVFMAFAYYTAPEDFSTTPTSPASNQTDRKVSVTATFLPSGGAPELLEAGELVIVRPPVALIHGLHDEGASWQWSVKDDPRFNVHVANYKFANGDPFLRNRFVPRHAIIEALELVRNKGFAATKADVFGHSMGGVLSRMYTADVLNVNGVDHAMDFKRVDNYHQGDIHKLTTVNTPHYGSTISDLLVLPDGQLTKAGRAAQWWESERCIGCGAVRDLGSRSVMTEAIKAVSVPMPVHAFWGDGESVTPNHEYTKEKLLIAGICGMTLQTVMSGDSDAVVPVVSQRAGLPPASSTLHQAAEGLHWPTVNEFPFGQANSHAINLLNTSVNDAAFSNGFPAYNGFLPPTPPCDITQLVIVPSARATESGQAGLDGIEITTPTPGLLYNGGDIVTVTVGLLGAYNPDTVYFSMLLEGRLNVTVVQLDSPPFQVDFVLPNDHVGMVEFSAIAVDSSQVVALAQNIAGTLDTTAVLTGISILQPTVNLPAFSDTARATVVGAYNDGVSRVLRSTSGTVYSVVDSTIAIVDSAGVITAIGLGTTILTVSNGPFMADVVINVTSVPFDFDSDGAIGFQDDNAFIGCFSGPNSISMPITMVPTSCRDFFDRDDDDDIDLQDWAKFQSAFAP